MSDWGFADIYGQEEESAPSTTALEDVVSDDWRNILVVGRANKGVIFPETLALIGHARELADSLGCRVEVLFMGSDVQDAVETTKRYPVDTVYSVKAPDYTTIQQTAGLIAQVVKKRRPELILFFQSRSGDAVAAYAASELGVGYALGVKRVELDTSTRRAQVTHQGTDRRFELVSRLLECPQFVSIQGASFRAPIEDPYSSAKSFELEISVPNAQGVKVVRQDAPKQVAIERQPIVVVAGGRVRSSKDVDEARKLAEALGAGFGVTPGVFDRGLAEEGDVLIGQRDTVIHPKLVLAVGCRGGLDLLEGIRGTPTIVAIGAGPKDPIRAKATYIVDGEIQESVRAVLDAL